MKNPYFLFLKKKYKMLNNWIILNKYQNLNIKKKIFFFFFELN